jgi:hypothetical protein
MTETKFELKTFGSDTMLNHHLAQKLKLIGTDLINILTNMNKIVQSNACTIYVSGW